MRPHAMQSLLMVFTIQALSPCCAHLLDSSSSEKKESSELVSDFPDELIRFPYLPGFHTGEPYGADLYTIDHQPELLVSKGVPYLFRFLGLQYEGVSSSIAWIAPLDLSLGGGRAMVIPAPTDGLEATVTPFLFNIDTEKGDVILYYDISGGCPEIGDPGYLVIYSKAKNIFSGTVAPAFYFNEGSMRFTLKASIEEDSDRIDTAPTIRIQDYYEYKDGNLAHESLGDWKIVDDWQTAWGLPSGKPDSSPTPCDPPDEDCQPLFSFQGPEKLMSLFKCKIDSYGDVIHYNVVGCSNNSEE